MRDPGNVMNRQQGSRRGSSSDSPRPADEPLPKTVRCPAVPGGCGRRQVLITGGAGFIGTNLAARLAAAGYGVRIFDSLLRPGVEQNLEWLLSTFGSQIDVEIADVRNRRALESAVSGVERVYHLAAQVAVTTSLDAPADDFDVNLRGTFGLLDILRQRPSPPSLLFTSTNKVYGNLQGVTLEEGPARYEPADPQFCKHGISEEQPLDFKSPYGCSKGGADQYVLDFAHCYRLPAVVFRMSCIYGEHQFGNEDQGWVAHFLIRALARQPLTIYGDGKQVRDILWAEDLVEAMQTALDRLDRTAGRAFNIGGGPGNTTSLRELIALVEQYTGRPLRLERSAWRKGDQRYYVSDIRRFANLTGWRPRTTVAEGVSRLCRWLEENRVAELLQADGHPSQAAGLPLAEVSHPAGPVTAGPKTTH